MSRVRVVSYVDGVRWGPIAVTDEAGRATSRVPMKSAGAANVRFDVAGIEGSKASYVNGPAIDKSSPWLSNEVTVQVTPPAPVGSLPPVTWDVMADTWVGTDALGRSLPTFDEVGPPSANKTVGLFYYVWHEHLSRTMINRREPLRVISEIASRNPADPPYEDGWHHWGESLFGYYNSGDEYVLRKHAQMLADAGVDVLLYDTSNNLGYLEQWLIHADLLTSLRESGQAAPQVAHLCWASTDGGVLGDLVRDFYDPGLYRDLWFQWKGKPLLLADAAKLPPSLKQLADRFTLRTSWAWTDPNGWFGDGKDKWPWLAEVPYAVNWHEEKGRAEQASVTAGHHPTTIKGKSMSKGVQPPRDRERSGEGIQFAEQFDYALKLDPEFLFITQWNEWIAMSIVNDREGMPYVGRTLHKGQRFFVDVYDPEFNRDVEPMTGGVRRQLLLPDGRRHSPVQGRSPDRAGEAGRDRDRWEVRRLDARRARVPRHARRSRASRRMELRLGPSLPEHDGPK